jgi:RNA polymerase sigma factor (sigma-70 family)
VPHSNQLQQAFTEKIRSHLRLIQQIARTYCWDATAREDLVQEIILQLWRAFPGYDSQYAFSTWLYRIGLNTAISYVRKETTRNRNEKDYMDFHVVQPASDTDPRLEEVYQWIEQLPPLDKALVLMYLEGLKNPEIAEVMGISVSNVGTRLTRIRQKLSQQAQHQNS